MGGLGTELCHRLHAEGFLVAATHSPQNARRLLGDLGRIDVLVNNAGITRDRSMRKMSQEDWHAVMGTDLDSAFNMTRPVLGTMIARCWGRIINISSVNGQQGAFGQANYAAAKAGMHGFTKSLALGAPRHHGQYRLARLPGHRDGEPGAARDAARTHLATDAGRATGQTGRGGGAGGLPGVGHGSVCDWREYRDQWRAAYVLKVRLTALHRGPCWAATGEAWSRLRPWRLAGSA